MPQALDPNEVARAAHLRYTTDSSPGIQRVRRGRGFSYVKPDGTIIRDTQELDRIRSLAIPPAWHDVWISPSPAGHIQATGRDDKGRKQYRYHPRWREVRDAAKYDRMIAFGKALPAIRKRTSADLGLPGLPREKVLATVVDLLETTLIRIGNEEYATNNGSYGLTTLRNRHVDVGRGTVRFHFRGKSGQYHEVSVNDRRIVNVVKRCRDLPGQELFQFVDDGERRSVTSDDVNDYLQEIAGAPFTAKDFRTWGGSILAARALLQIGACDSSEEGKHNIVCAIKQVAEQLGNTPTVCRKCYIHPDIVDAYLDGSLIQSLQEMNLRRRGRPSGLSPEEAAILAFLEKRARNRTS
jgi:DNA topoisomerase-1